MNPSLLTLVSVAASVLGAAGGATAAIYQMRMRALDKAVSIRAIRGLVGAVSRVQDISDPRILGVHIAAPRAGGAPQEADRLPPYVLRDSDAKLRQALAEPGFVLVVGDTATGKTRSAFEAIRAVLPSHILIAPLNREGIAAAIDAAVKTRRSVVWLDDLEFYLGPGGLSPGKVWQVLAGDNHHRVIVATMRSGAEDRLNSSDPEVRAVLAQAQHVALRPMFSLEEQKRARILEDPRLAEALANSGRYGVVEYLAAAPQLLSEWENAWAPGFHPRGAALVAAAVDLRRAGFTSPLPQALLEELVESYLTPRGGEQSRPEPPEDAWQWVAQPRQAGTSLLVPVGENEYEVFDYLVNAVQRGVPAGEYIPATVIETALPYADAADATAIATIAQSNGSYQLAEAAIRRALAIQGAQGRDNPLALTSRSQLVTVLYALGRLHEAEDEGQALVEDQTRVLGANHPSTLTSRDMLARIRADRSLPPQADDKR